MINGAGSVSDLLLSDLMNPGGESPDFLSWNLKPLDERSGAGNIGGLLADKLELGLRTLPRILFVTSVSPFKKVISNVFEKNEN